MKICALGCWVEALAEGIIVLMLAEERCVSGHFWMGNRDWKMLERWCVYVSLWSLSLVGNTATVYECHMGELCGIQS